MLLEIDNSELLYMLEHHESLKAKVTNEFVTVKHLNLNTVLWVVTACGFEKACCLLLWVSCLACSSTLKMKVICSSEMFGSLPKYMI
jgi:hypothetical protein